MPDLQPESAGALPPAALVEATVRALDDDYALGFECADPSLQIESWGQQCSPEQH